MQFNGFLKYIQKHSLPFSNTKVTVPCEEVHMNLDTVSEHLYTWLKNCEFVSSISAEVIKDCVAYDVSVTFITDGSFQLMEVE